MELKYFSIKCAQNKLIMHKGKNDLYFEFNNNLLGDQINQRHDKLVVPLE